MPADNSSHLRHNLPARLFPPQNWDAPRLPPLRHSALTSSISCSIDGPHASSRVQATNQGAKLSEIAPDALYEIDRALNSILQRDMRPQECLPMMFELLAPVGDRYSCLMSYPDLMAFTEVARACEHQLDRPNSYIQDLKSQDVFAPDIPTA